MSPTDNKTYWVVAAKSAADISNVGGTIVPDVIVGILYDNWQGNRKYFTI